MTDIYIHSWVRAFNVRTNHTPKAFPLYMWKCAHLLGFGGELLLRLLREQSHNAATHT